MQSPKKYITPQNHPSRKAVVLTENFSVGQFSEALRLFLPPRVPPIETICLITPYGNAKENPHCLLKTLA